MDEQAGLVPRLRRARLRGLPTPTDVELYVQDAPPLAEVIDDLPEPRIAELSALLREVDDLRSTLRRDLTLAATAADAGADDLAGWLLLGDAGEVRAFEGRALAHLRALDDSGPTPAQPSTAIPAPRRPGRMLPAAPLVAAAAAVVGFLTGVVPGVGGPTTTSPQVSNAALSYAQLTHLAATGASASSISEAAEKFHADLAPLVAAAGSDPEAAERAIELLQSERAVIAGEADSPALRAVLAQADLLVRRLRASLPPHKLRPVLPVAPDHDSRRPSSEPKSSPTPKASPTTSPTPKASPTPSPSSSPRSGTASPTPGSSAGPIPGAPVHP